MAVKATPDGYNSVQPYLLANGAAKLVDFITAAFGATERMRMSGPDGKIGHTEVELGNSVIMIADAMEGFAPTQSMIQVYVDDVDATYKKALAAGATSQQEPSDQFYGDRVANVVDPLGNRWSIHTHVEDVPPEEMEKRAAAAMAQS